MTARYPDPAELLPHGGPALVIRRILEHGDEHIVCEGFVSSDTPFATAEGLPAYIGLELTAQASGLLEGVQAMGETGRVDRRLGYLVRARRLRWPAPWLPLETTLRVEVHRQGIAGPLHLYDGRVTLNGETLFTGTFGTFSGGAA